MALRENSRITGGPIGAKEVAVYIYPEEYGAIYLLNSSSAKTSFQRTLRGTIDLHSTAPLTKVAVIKCPIKGLEISNINCHPVLLIKVSDLWVGIEVKGQGILIQISDKFSDIRTMSEGLVRDRSTRVSLAVRDFVEDGLTLKDLTQFLVDKDITSIGRKSGSPAKALVGVLFKKFSAQRRYRWRAEDRRTKRFLQKKRTKNLIIRRRKSESSIDDDEDCCEHDNDEAWASDWGPEFPDWTGNGESYESTSYEPGEIVCGYEQRINNYGDNRHNDGNMRHSVGPSVIITQVEDTNYDSGLFNDIHHTGHRDHVHDITNCDTLGGIDHSGGHGYIGKDDDGRGGYSGGSSDFGVGYGGGDCGVGSNYGGGGDCGGDYAGGGE